MVITKTRIFSADRHDISDPQGISRQKIGLQCQTVSIPAADLEHRRQSFFLQDHRTAQRAHPHDGIAHLRHNERVDAVFDPLGIRNHLGGVHSLGGFHLRKDGKFICLEFAF